MTPTEAAAPTTFQQAQRKARFGHYDWLAWRSRDGAYNVARRSPSTVKRVLLDIGTSGRFTLIAASTGVPFSYGWRSGITMIRNARVGC